jgi:tRNA(fMet)-specific endonuclease VapC
MGRLILDTTVLIDAERHGDAIETLIADDDDVAIAAITVAELLVGVERADRKRRPARERYVADVINTIPIETYDTDVARSHARLLAHVRGTGQARGAHDLIIAATALARRRAIVSADARAFADLPGVAVRV